MNKLVWCFTLAGSLSALVAGCSSPPKGTYSGRVDTTTTTKAEFGGRQISITALSEASDQVAQQLAADLDAVPELNQGFRSTIVFGDINNKTGIVSTTDFEAFRMNTRAKLMQSRSLMNKVKWIESRSRVEQIVAREQAQGAAGTLPALNPQYTFFLNGDMYRVSRGNDKVNYYTMTYNLTSMQDASIVWTSSPYEIKQSN